MRDDVHPGVVSSDLQAVASGPGQHMPADPERIHADVDELLGGAAGAELNERARVLENAHEVLVHALATVDKF